MKPEEATQAEPIGTNNELMVVITESGVEQSTALTLQSSFMPFFEKAKEWKDKAATLVVTDASQVAEMKMARVARLALKQIRVDADKTRKALKEDSLRYGKAVQGVYSVIDYLIAPIEQHLEDQEKFVERQEAQRKSELKEQRDAELLPYIAFVPYQIDLGELTEPAWQTVISGAKLQYQAKIQADIQAETDRIAKEQADAAQREQERIEREQAIENERLARIELENQKAIMAEQQEKAEKERLAILAATAERDRLAEIERNEKEATLAKANAEREAQMAAEREELNKALAAEQVKAAQMAAQVQAQVEAQKAETARLEKIESDRIAAEKKAAKAPDKIKLLIWVQDFNIDMVPCSTPEGTKVALDIETKFNAFKAWAKTQIQTL